MKLNTLTLTEALRGLTNKEFTVEELTEDVLDAIEQENERLNIYLTLSNLPIEAAKQASLQSPLKGIPLAIKDNFSTKWLRTTASSTVLDNFVPQYDSTVTRRLKEAGACCIGKTNLDAWAHGSSTETSQYGRTLNPRNPEYLPGGSSGGSAAAVAADMCIAAIGSETAGSIRQPSAWCGTVGLKPTYGRVSRYGVVAMMSSTDSPGPITKTVEDSAVLLNLIAGQDKYDGTTSPQPAPDFTVSIGKSIKGMKIGYLYSEISELTNIYQTYLNEFRVFEELGASVEPVHAIDPHYAIGVYTIAQRGEVSSNLARYDGIRYGSERSLFGDEAKRRIMLGTYTLSKGYSDQYYLTAQKVRTLIIEDFKKLFQQYDVLIAPTSPGYAKKVGATEGAAMFGELEDMLLEASSLAGLPGISVPCHHDEKTKLYLGLDIMGPMWREDLVIQVAHAYEQNTKWNPWVNGKK